MIKRRDPRRSICLALLTALLTARPAFAVKPFGEDDPVEQASASLSRTLAAIEAERSDAATRSAAELARLRTLDSSSRSVVLGQGSLDWLIGQSDPLKTGIVPVAGREGLLVSYQIPLDDPLAFLRGRSWTYDNALAAVAFLTQGQSARAKMVLSALNRLVSPEGAIGFSYKVDSLLEDDLRARTGTVGWVGYSFAFYQRLTGDTAFQGTAERIAGYLKTLQQSSGLLKGGPDVSWVSTEHNIDAYFFYRELSRVTGKSDYQTTANQIKTGLLSNLWVSKGATSGHFLQGVGDSTPALDANSWGAIFLKAIDEKTKAGYAMQYVESTFQTRQKISGTSTRITGYAPDATKKTVWLEGTAGVATAYLKLGNTSKANSILSNVATLQSTLQKQGRWHGALVYATPRYKNADGDTFAPWESVTATSWLNCALAQKSGETRFWDHD